MKNLASRLALAIFGAAGAAAVAQPPTSAEGYPSQDWIADRYAQVTDPYVQLAQAPGLPADNPLGAATPRPSESGMPPGTRPGAFQKLNLRGIWMPRGEGDSIGVSGVDLDVVFGLPFPERESPLLITPAYRVRFLDGPDFIDVPSRVHDAEVDFHHFRKLTDRWMFDGAVTLGVYADDHSFDNSDAFRVSGRALAIRDHLNGWKSVLGVVYLNRAGASVLPAVGWTYAEGDYKLDLLFPRPRAAWRIDCTCPDYDERWVYVQGEFGGGRWSVQRDTGAADTLAYSDWRLLVGLERKLIGGISRKWEMGYVFNRDIEYDSIGTGLAVDDAFFLRAGLTY